jgi:hypothetical protein
MRKTLLIAAAAFAASVISSQAQVYSQNIVGYVNLPVINGYQMYSTPLDLDGTGTNNTVTTVLGTNVPVNTQVLTWTGSSYQGDLFSIPKHQTVAVWSTPNQPLNPGEGYFIYNPSNAVTVTVVGTALVGTNSNPALTPGGGYYALSSVSPIAGDIVTNFGYQPSLNDQVLIWNPTTQSYSGYLYAIPKHQTSPVWSPTLPQIQVGQSFFLDTTNVNPQMTEVLNVN